MSNLNLPYCSNPNALPKFIQKEPNCSLKQNELNTLHLTDSKPEIKRAIPRIFANKTIGTIDPKFLEKPSSPGALSDLSQIKLKEKWSWREIGGNKIEDGRRNQEQCGCCWAFSVSTVLGDRYGIKYNIKAPYPSVANLVSCGGPWFGSESMEKNTVAAKDQCHCGGVTSGGADWLTNKYIITEKCWPFSTISSNSVAPNCTTKLGDGCCIDSGLNYCCNENKSARFSVKKDSVIQVLKYNNTTPLLDETIRAIKLEISTRGPVSTTIFVPPDFQDWWNSYLPSKGKSTLLTEDIYIPKFPVNKASCHAIVITGWGKRNGVNYWEIRNSWGYPSYAYLAMSSDIDKELYYGIDIPILFPPLNSNESASSITDYEGGVIAFEAGDLVGLDKNTGTGGKPIAGAADYKPKDFSSLQTPKINYTLIIIIAIILIVCLMFYIFL